jgi:hypothetical protein
VDFQPVNPGSYAVVPTVDEILGPAERLTARYHSLDNQVGATLEVTIAEGIPAFTYTMDVQAATAASPARFDVFDAQQGGLRLSGPMEYLGLLSPGHIRGTLEPGDDRLGLPLPQGAPMLLWNERDRQGYVLGIVDESIGRTNVWLSAVDGKVGVEIEVRPRVAVPTASARLFVQRVGTSDLTRAFAGYRAVLDRVAPAPPIPDGFRQQWGSWYVYGAGITEERIRAQIDTIAGTYADLGPWQIVIDAGWYLSGSLPDGEMGAVDLEKFPSGMRALVDYAHERGIGVVLYGSAPWIDSRPSLDSWWMVQQGFVREHPDWLILVDEDEEGATYVYDLSNPELRAYLDELMRRYLVEFDADGILLDMVGVIGEEQSPLRGGPISTDRGVPAGLGQTMEVYRFSWDTATRYKPEVWIEGAWAAPPLARAYAQTWRYADEYPAFTHPYPFGGLLEHITFTVLQEEMLGRRSHVGFIYGPDETLPIQRQWLAAAVALQRQTILSTDLAGASPEATQMYREYLAALRPFAGTSVYGPGIPPEVFSTTVDGTTYLGLLNAGPEARTVAVDLIEHGLAPDAPALVFDPETREAFATGRHLTAPVPAQSLRLLVVRAEPGVLWADRSWEVRATGNELRVYVDAGPVDGGRLWLYAPAARSVWLDGAPQRQFGPDAATGLATVEMLSGTSHDIHVTFSR